MRWRWHSKGSQFEHRTHFVSMETCDPHRDSYWTQNSAAILAFIGGCEIEYLEGVVLDPIGNRHQSHWRELRLEQFSKQTVRNDAMSVFSGYQCRVKRSEA